MRSILIGLSLLPPCLVAALIVRYGVDVPFLDQWGWIPLFEKLEHGNLTLADLFAQQTAHRFLFPRAFFLGLGLCTGWDVRYEMISIFIAACVVSINLAVLARRTIP